MELGKPIPGILEGDGFDGTDAGRMGYDAAVMALTHEFSTQIGATGKNGSASMAAAVATAAGSGAGDSSLETSSRKGVRDVRQVLRDTARHLAVATRVMEKLAPEPELEAAADAATGIGSEPQQD